MDLRWLQGNIEEYSFLALAQKILPETEFPIVSYPGIGYYLVPGAEEYRKALIPRFHYATKQEEKDIFDGCWTSEKDYEDVNMKYGFYFPDVPIGKLEDLFPSWFCDPFVDKLVEPYYTEDNGSIYFSKKRLVTAVFIILHEFGHYLDYKRFGSTESYAKWVYAAKASFRENDAEIIALHEAGTLTRDRYNARWKVYRDCDDEKSADTYALENLQAKTAEALEIISG